jgi:hypothetical protein
VGPKNPIKSISVAPFEQTSNKRCAVRSISHYRVIEKLGVVYKAEDALGCGSNAVLVDLLAIAS